MGHEACNYALIEFDMRFFMKLSGAPLSHESKYLSANILFFNLRAANSSTSLHFQPIVA